MQPLSSHPPRVVAHRGSAHSAIENTLPAFARALDEGAQALELDVHLTRDRDLAVIHDETLERTFGRPGVVSQMTREELRAVGVPMLREVLALADCELVVEIKHPKNGHYQGIEDILVDQLAQAQAGDRTQVISFDEDSLKKVHRLDPDLETGFLYAGPPVDPAKVRDELGVSLLSPQFASVTAGFVDRAHRAGLKVQPWVVNESRDMKRMIAKGVDSITTDEVPRLLAALESPIQPQEPSNDQTW